MLKILQSWKPFKFQTFFIVWNFWIPKKTLDIYKSLSTLWNFLLYSENYSKSLRDKIRVLWNNHSESFRTPMELVIIRILPLVLYLYFITCVSFIFRGFLKRVIILGCFWHQKTKIFRRVNSRLAKVNGDGQDKGSILNKMKSYAAQKISRQSTNRKK